MNQEERLALAVQAQVAEIRADQSKERSALIQRRIAPLHEAFARVGAILKRPLDFSNRRDRALIDEALESLGAQHPSDRDLDASVVASKEADELEAAMLIAARALTSAWTPADGGTLAEWIGCSPEDFRTAVDAALAAETPTA